MHPERKQLWVFAGPNGAGKSTVANTYIKGRIPIVNPDNIALAIDSQRRNEREVVLRAGRMALEERIRRLDEGRSFAIETTMSGSSELRLMKQAGDKGYKVNLVYIGIADKDVSLERVAGRVAKGGHDVPQEDIERRFDRSLASLKKGLKIADRTFVLDNTIPGRKPFLLLRKEAGKVKYLAEKLPEWFKTLMLEQKKEQNRGMKL